MYNSTFLLDTKHNNVHRYFEKMFWFAFLMKNKLIKNVKANLDRLKEDEEYKALLVKYGEYKKNKNKTKEDEENFKLVKKQLNEKIAFHKLDKASIYKYLSVQQKKYSRYISSQMSNAIADDVLSALKKVLYSDGKEIHFKKFDDIKTIAAKSILNGMFLVCVVNENANKVNYFVEFRPSRDVKIRVPIIVKDYDKYGKQVIESAFGISEEELLKSKDNNKSNKNNGYVHLDERFVEHKVKYATLKRKMFSNGYRYYIQLTIDDVPPLKHTKGLGTCGIDIGVSSVASVSDEVCYLEDLAPKIEEYNQKLIVLQKKMERSLRLNNKDCYDEDGVIIKGSKFKKTNSYKKLQKRYKALSRKRTCYVRQVHCGLANKIIENSGRIFYEEMNFKALQKKSKNLERSDKVSEIKQKDGSVKEVKKFKRRKRFGKTLQNKAPASFLNILLYKCDFQNIPIDGINTTTFKASQYDHVTNEYVKKELSQRFHQITTKNGEILLIQRDLYSAFLIKNSCANLEHTNRKKCIEEFEAFLKNHDTCIANVKETNQNRLSCFGF